jgi:hypothetical protein
LMIKCGSAVFGQRARRWASQSRIMYVNTLMAQDVLAESEWEDAFTAEDRRGLTPLFWTHVAPYGEVRLNMAKRLELRGDVPSER